jgi:hypothetical protein
MITLKFHTEVGDDRRINVSLPDDAPLGPVDVTVTVAPVDNGPNKGPRTSLADWAEEIAEDWGSAIQSTDVEGFTGRRF